MDNRLSPSLLFRAKETLDSNESISKHDVRCDEPVQLLVYYIYLILLVTALHQSSKTHLGFVF